MEEKFYFLVQITSKSPDASLFDEVNRVAQESFFCEGVEEFALEESRVDEILGERAYSGGDIPHKVLEEVERVTLNSNEVSFKYYFYSENCEKNANLFFDWAKNRNSSFSVTKEKQQWQDWNQEWRSHYKTLEVSPELRVIPEWMKDEEERRSGDIYIYPGQGFGTGEHETTFLCLQLFEDVLRDLPKKGSCLDFGCGSGILGIAAIAKKKMQVDFCDIDSEALNNCLQNLQLNFQEEELQGHSLVLRDRFQIEQSYDLVFANILENVLIGEKPVILSELKKGAYLIVSGLLNHQVENIVESYHEVRMIKTLSKGDWSAILFQRLSE